MEIRTESEQQEAKAYTAPKLEFEGDLSEVTKDKPGSFS